MLYTLGGVQIKVAPFSVDQVSRSSSADIAAKPVIGAMKAHEFMGQGDGKLSLTGQILPYHLGGQDQLEVLHTMCRDGERFNVMRGDGRSLGYFSLTSVSEGHKELAYDGVGYVVNHTLSLLEVEFSPGAAEGTISKILQLFDLLR